MPFDSTVVEDVTVTRRKQLVEALRDPKLAEHHRWDFASVGGRTVDEPGGHCGTAGCAVGVADGIWPRARLTELFESGDERFDAFFGMCEAEVDRVFDTPRTYGCESYSAVTPLMVADVLEATYANG